MRSLHLFTRALCLLGAASLAPIALVAAACSSSSAGGTNHPAEAGQDATGDSAVEPSEAGDAGDAGDADPRCANLTYLCPSSLAPAMTPASLCDAGTTVQTCANYVLVAYSGVDTSTVCTYDDTTGARVAAQTTTPVISCSEGTVTCSTWVSVDCGDAGDGGDAGDASHLVDGSAGDAGRD